jgi:chromosome segregation ATPase
MERQNSLASPTTPDDPALELKRKVAMLNKALKKEQEDKQKEFEELEGLKKKLSLLELSLNEKDAQIEISNQERERLQNDLNYLIERSPKKVAPVVDSVANLEAENKTLLEEFNELTKKNKELKNKFEVLFSSNSEVKGQVELKEKHIHGVIEDLTSTLAELERQEEQVLRELEQSTSYYSSLSDSYNKMTNEFHENQSHKKQIEEEIISFTKELQIKQNQLLRLNERLLKQSENEAILSDKLMQYKNELVEAESYYQRHEVVKVNNSLNNPVVLILKHDHTGEYILEIEERNDKVVYGVTSVDCVARHPHNDRRFFIRINQGYTLEFESPNSESIVSKMTFFLENAKND